MLSKKKLVILEPFMTCQIVVFMSMLIDIITVFPSCSHQVSGKTKSRMLNLNQAHTLKAEEAIRKKERAKENPIFGSARL
jgi:hypothetical protein